MNENYTIEELEAYLFGHLNPERKAQLEEEMKIDLALKTELDALKISREAVELAGWKALISKSQSEYLAERSKTKVRPHNSGQTGFGFWMGRIAAALAFILVGSAAVLFFSTSPESITSKQLDYSIPVLRSSENQLEELEKAFLEKDFDQVLIRSKDISSYDAKAYFLIGMAYLEKENGVKAEEFLTEIEKENIQNSESNYADQVDYYLINSFLLQGKPDLAEARIQKILDDPNHSYHGNISQLDLLKVKILKLKN